MLEFAWHMRAGMETRLVSSTCFEDFVPPLAENVKSTPSVPAGKKSVSETLSKGLHRGKSWWSASNAKAEVGMKSERYPSHRRYCRLGHKCHDVVSCYCGFSHLITFTSLSASKPHWWKWLCIWWQRLRTTTHTLMTRELFSPSYLVLFSFVPLTIPPTLRS